MSTTTVSTSSIMPMPVTTAPEVLRTSHPTPCWNMAISAIPSGTAHNERRAAGLLGQLAGTVAVRSPSTKARTNPRHVSTAARRAPSTSLTRATCHRLGATRKFVAGMPKRYSVVTSMDCCTITMMPVVMATVATTWRGMYGRPPERERVPKSAPYRALKSRIRPAVHQKEAVERSLVHSAGNRLSIGTSR